MSTVASVSWSKNRVVQLRVFTSDGSQVTEHVYDEDGQWKPGPFSAPGATVAATSWQDAAGEIHIRLFIGRNGVMDEHRWDDGAWRPGSLDATGVSATAATVVEGDGRVHVHVFVRDAANRVTEHRWENDQWTTGTCPETSASSFAAVSSPHTIRMVSSDADRISERSFRGSWYEESFPHEGTVLAGTSTGRSDAGVQFVFVARDGAVTIYVRGRESWEAKAQPIEYGAIDGSATVWAEGDGDPHVRAYLRNAAGTVREYCWDGSGHWYVGDFPWPSPPGDWPRWYTNGGSLYQRSTPDAFIIRGVCYSRAFIGDLEAMDALTNTNGEVWEPDLASMREMGVNTIKIYGMNLRKDHSLFLEKAWNGGDRPIFILLSLWIDPTLLGLRPGTPPALEQLQQDYALLVRRYAGFPAVMGFSIGAEVNNDESLRYDLAFWLDFMSIAAAVRNELTRDGHEKIITTGLIDGTADVVKFKKKSDGVEVEKDAYPMIGHPNPEPPSEELTFSRRLSAALSLGLEAQEQTSPGARLIDVWGFDIYKLPAQFPRVFQQYSAAFSEPGKPPRPIPPLLIAEFGEPASAHTADIVSCPNGQSLPCPRERNEEEMKTLSCQLERTWRVIEGYARRENPSDPAPIGCGGCIFEWADEWWKGDPKECPLPGEHSGLTEVMKYTRADCAPIFLDEKWFGLNALDRGTEGRTLIPRRTYRTFKRLWRNEPGESDCSPSVEAAIRPCTRT